MDSLQASLLLPHYVRTSELHSALPEAPVVPHAESRPRAVASRIRLAGALHRLADAVAPRMPSPARRHEAYACGRAH